jgi:hypothetical protein
VTPDAAGAASGALARTRRSLRTAGSRPAWLPSRGGAARVAGWWRVGMDAAPPTLGAADWCVVVPAGEALAREALLHLADAIAAEPSADLLYGDAAHPTGVRAEPWSYARRPGWSPERLLGHCYTGGMLAVSPALVARAGGPQVLAEGSAHDRALRLGGLARRVARVPEVLAIAAGPDSRPEADADAVRRHLTRAGVTATVTRDDAAPAVRVARRIGRRARIAVVVATRGTTAVVRGRERVLVVDAVRSLVERSTYRELEFVVVADTPTPEAVRAELARVGGPALRILDYDRPFNFAEKNNLGALATDAELLLLLNDDTELDAPDALETMVGHLEDPGVAVVGPYLRFEDGSIQSAGHVFNPEPFDLYRARPADTAGPQNLLRVAREVSSVIAACMLVRHSVFDEVGGLCTRFPANWNDVDFCCKVRRAGHRIVVTPHATFTHFESKTRVARLVESEVARLGERWGSWLDDDPYFHPRLQRYTNVWKTDSTSQRSLDEALGPTAPIAAK